MKARQRRNLQGPERIHSNDKNLIRLPRQHLPQPDGGVSFWGPREEGKSGSVVSDRIGGSQPGGTGKPGLSDGEAGACCAWDFLRVSPGKADYKGDYAAFDYLIGMDRENLSGMRRVFGADPEGKLRLLLSFAGKDRDVADPWYTDDFEAAYRDIDEGCRALLAFLLR